MGSHVARMEDGRRAFKILTGRPTGKIPLGRPRRRWEDNIKIYKTIILPVVIYGCEAWSLTLRKERRLRVFENWIPRQI